MPRDTRDPRKVLAAEVVRIAAEAQKVLNEKAHAVDWRTIYDTREEFDSTPNPTFSVANFLQDYSVNAICGLSGEGKTWLSLNLAAAMLRGPGKLWETFNVTERAAKIVYLIPECSRVSFKPRLKAMQLYDEIGVRLFVRTLSKGPVLELTNLDFLSTIQGAHVFCDTAIRFMQCTDENSANEAATGLSDDFFAMQRAEAKSITALFHSPKSFAKERIMTLENMIRGTGEFGAMLSTAWGLRQIDESTNTIHIENLKARDFQACGPLQLIGRPYIDQTGSFKMHLEPGFCGKLDKYLADRNHRGGGAPEEQQEAKAANLELLRRLLANEPLLTSPEIVKRFAKIGITVSDSSIRRYRRDLEACSER